MKKNFKISSSEIFLVTGLVLAASSALLAAQTTNSTPVVDTNSVLISTNAALASTNLVGQIVTNFIARRGDDAPVAAVTNLPSASGTNAFPLATTNAAPVIPANIPGRPLYSAFKIINDRNIFDPNRRPGMTNIIPDRPRTVEVETFSFSGVLSSDRGTYAIFNSSSSAYRKVLKENGVIAGYTVTYIEPPDLVELESGGKKIELTAGTGLRRRDGGPWEKVDSAPNFSTSSDSGSRSGSSMMGSSRGSFNSEAPTNVEASGNTSSGGGASDALKRLMLKREQELKNEKP